MSRLLSQQDDFRNQLSMLEQLIRDAGHECLFLPKFHCELNPIDMVCLLSFPVITFLILHSCIVLGMVQILLSTSNETKFFSSKGSCHQDPQ